MPHFFLMNEAEMEEAEALQLRARLHIRSYWTLVRHGRFAQGIITLYDGFESAVRRFCLLYAPDVPPEFQDRGTRAYKYLLQTGSITCGFDIESYENLISRALEPDFDRVNPDFDYDQLWQKMEDVFRELEILPFDLDSLPEEDEATRKVMGMNLPAASCGVSQPIVRYF